MHFLCIAAALLAAAGTAAAQNRTTEVEARSYIQSAFITGAAHAILENEVVVGERLREQLALPAGASRDRIYEALFTLTEDRPLSVRRARSAGSAGRPAFVIEGGVAPLLVVYDLERNAISRVSLPEAPAAVGGTASAPPEPKAIRVAEVAPVPAPAPLAMHFKPIAFAFNDATLQAQAKLELEREGLPKLAQIRDARYVVRGYADRLGTPAYNQRLSERRAAAVRDYLVERGVPAELIEWSGLGATMSQTDCRDMRRRELIECLAPDRRVTVAIEPSPL